MPEIKEQITPLGPLFALLTNQYLSVLGAKLSDLLIDRYFYAFWVISNNDGKITSKRLAELTQTDKVFIVRIITYLTEKGFLQRLKHPQDNRSFLLHVTEKGRKCISA